MCITHQMKQDEMGMAYGTPNREEKCIQEVGGET